MELKEEFFKIPLFIGSFVDVKIPGRQLTDVVQIPAKALRDRDTVWVVVNKQLQIRNVKIAHIDLDNVYISGGVTIGEKIVISPIKGASKGLKVRIDGDNEIGPERNKEETKKRKFTQSVELIINFKDIDVKKGFAINEVVQLPKTSSPATVCVIATGDMSQKAKTAKADVVIGNEELTKYESNKRESRKFINKYDFFLADTKIMPTVGKALGQLLGPRGKMPTPVPFNASIEAFLARFRTSIKVRTRASLSISCKIGDESMEDADLAINANAVLNAIEKKLPNGEKNIKKIMIKTTMGKPIKQVQEVKKKHA